MQIEKGLDDSVRNLLKNAVKPMRTARRWNVIPARPAATGFQGTSVPVCVLFENLESGGPGVCVHPIQDSQRLAGLSNRPFTDSARSDQAIAGSSIFHEFRLPIVGNGFVYVCPGPDTCETARYHDAHLITADSAILAYASTGNLKAIDARS